MNSQNNKNNAIKAAYGEYYKDYRRFIDENGFIYQSDLFFPETGMKKDGVEAEIISVEKKHKWSNIKWRPMSLQGLENNRGWTRIESEEDLPKPKGVEDVLVIIETGEITVENSMSLNDIEVRRYWLRTISHWQPFIKPNLPLY